MQLVAERTFHETYYIQITSTDFGSLHTHKIFSYNNDIAYCFINKISLNNIYLY